MTDDDPLVPEAGLRMEGLGLGIDVGGTGVKAAVVDLSNGELRTDRIREKTPQPATPDAVVETIATVVERVEEEHPGARDLPAGCGLPGVVKLGHVLTAANIDKGWIGAPAEELLLKRLKVPVLAINDADAAGLAELTYGAGEGRTGTVLLLTLGTGIGSAIFIDGRLLPNTELGHLEFRGKGAEVRLSGTSRERRGLSWKRWAEEFNEYIAQVELYFWPDLIIIGGGVSKVWDRYASSLVSRAPIVPARLLNTAGIAGAALAAAHARRVAGAASKSS
jgi:polyphosphate glucokinase